MAKSITLRHEAPEIEIDGEKYPLAMADYDVIKMCNDMHEKYEGYADRPHTVSEILVDLGEIRAKIDLILGAGAFEKLRKGLPVGMKLSIEWVGQISQAVSDMYLENALQ